MMSAFVRAAVVTSLAACASTTPRTRAVNASDALASVERAVDLQGVTVGALPQGKQATVLIVFASWCGPCRYELATLDELRTHHPKVRIIGLNAYEEYEGRSDHLLLRRFLNEWAPWLRVVRAKPPVIAALGGVPKIPSLFVYDRRGILVREFSRAKRAPPSRAELRAVFTATVR